MYNNDFHTRAPKFFFYFFGAGTLLGCAKKIKKIWGRADERVARPVF